ncbi:LAFE_0F04214g1_1 [Lachancea fermentati]|uniref:Ubiquitin-activating enzyme E1-like n=1 Tax=Lachancea fermentati TaxID=4955 RepID=A0A1G4MEQ9_LACFM|nr:LAFE_0F04214g1_1 [Lachancea fermentati]
MGDPSIVKIVGQKNYAKLRSVKVLLVGAGGIGCELLKNLVLMEFGEIHVVDLDTIDLSNLNRQFLFRQRDIKQPKATTAVRAIQHVSNSKLVAYQSNIMDTEKFPLSWFSEFSLIFNALDNLEARRYVNQTAQFLHLPLLESGTAGFDGYIQPIIPGQTECFDCTTKETPKTFPVCTIRSTPSQPIHCIVWAKNFLFSQLFASSTSVATDEDLGTEDPQEIERIKQETNELHELQEYIKSGDNSCIPDIITKLFVSDIEKLLSIENLWKNREKPTPLHNFEISNQLNTDFSSVWTLQEQVNAFAEVTKKLMKRLATEKEIEFDKDDTDTLKFVATAANIRAYVFHLPVKSLFDVKQIAGNIIPAIATTNAIIAGLSSLASLRVLNLLKHIPPTDPKDLYMAFTAKASNISSNRYLSNSQLATPNPRCPVCSIARGVISLSTSALKSITLGELLDAIRTKYNYPGEVSLVDKSTQRLLADFDFDDLLGKSLSDMKLGQGSLLLVADERDDEEELKCSAEFYLQLDATGNKLRLPEIEVLSFKPQAMSPQEDEPDYILNGNGEIIIDEDNGDSRKRELEDASEPAAKMAKLDDDAIVLLD